MDIDGGSYRLDDLPQDVIGLICYFVPNPNSMFGACKHLQMLWKDARVLACWMIRQIGHEDAMLKLTRSGNAITIGHQVAVTISRAKIHPTYDQICPNDNDSIK